MNQMNSMMLKRAVLCAAVLTLAATVRAADDGGNGDQPKPHVGFMKGYVVRVDGSNLIFKAKAGPEVSVATTDATEVTIDGKPAKLADLTEGLFVQVLSANDSAEKIIAKTPKPK